MYFNMKSSVVVM